jgi:hypothetical protein
MEEYRRRLDLSGFEVWADSQRLVAGDRWDERLRFAISSSDFVVGLLSTYTWDGYQRLEVEQALAQRADREAPFFLPVFLNRRDWISGSEGWPAGLDAHQAIVADGLSTGWSQLYSTLAEATRMLELSVPPRLRAEARHDLTQPDVWRTVFDKDFFSLERNPNGRPLGMEWDLVLNGALAYDRATELMWTRTPVMSEGDPLTLDLKQASAVPGAVRSSHALFGSVSFRLPTLEEAMSLMTPATNTEGLHRNPYMSGSNYMLTCDTMPAPPFFYDASEVTHLVWVADFLSTDVQPVPLDSAWPIWLVASEKETSKRGLLDLWRRS